MMLFQRLITLSSLSIVTTSAFSASKASQLIRTSSTSSSSSSALNVGAVWTDDNHDYESTTPIFLMNRAEACANSESCSLEEAQVFLDDILHIQAEYCVGVGGTLSANAKNAVCDNVDVVAEVVANLRQKIQVERKRLAPVQATVHLFNVMMGFYVVSTILHGVAAVPNVPVDAPMFSSFSNMMSPIDGEAMMTNSRGVASILPQEWFWAIRDGYFPSLLSEAIHNGGGLVVDTSAFDEKVVVFTPQEWVWSVQNGSFPNMLQENMRYGGLVVDSDFDTEGVSPMTMQEVVWSIQGGYFGDAANHFFRNGGI